ncbi:MAG: dihydropteroate synthase [Bryobacterales bacterium]|nr:dihydropteroate synthase [Bryobacterales bacterium]
MFIIGELINSTRKRIREAVLSRDAAYIRETAVRQKEAGAGMLDVNGGVAGREVECLTWLVNVVQEAVDLPLCLDSSDPAALGAALPLVKGRAMINSITGEPARFEAVLPLVKQYNTKVVALAMGAAPPTGVEDRVAMGCRLVDSLTASGIALDDIYVDPCVLPVSTGGEHGKGVAEAVSQVMSRYPGVHTSVGLSNVSFGLPVRKLLNQTFLVLLVSRGLDTAIVDPCDRQLMANLAAAEALLGRDEFCAGYLRAYRAGKLEPPPPAGG